jgi:EAL and modified HD-GYP domain-containing signal transduction protein
MMATTMQEHPALAHVALGYSPMIDRQRAVVATRVTVVPERADTVPDAGDLIAALLEVWPTPAEAGELKLTLRPLDPAARPGAAKVAGPAQQPVSLNIAGEDLLRAVMDAGPPPHLMLEVPAFMASDPAHARALMALREAGSVLLIKGRPLAPLAPEVLACFSHSIVDTADERRTPGSVPTPGVRQVTTVQAGTRTSADIEQAFQRGAVAVLGWPLDDPAPKSTGRSTVPTDIQVVMELISGVDREEPVHKLESILKRDPTLAFRLLRYLNSPAFGLSAEINSFGHAIMMLGYARLKRWLALLLASSSKGANAKPLMHAAVRRGLLMEELARSNGDAEMRSEMFICGVFSLLDRLLQQPLPELMGSVPVPERVQQTLLGESGPYTPYLALVRAVEQETAYDIRECADQLLLGSAEVNRAVLAALLAARQLDG